MPFQKALILTTSLPKSKFSIKFSLKFFKNFLRPTARKCNTEFLNFLENRLKCAFLRLHKKIFRGPGQSPGPREADPLKCSSRIEILTTPGNKRILFTLKIYRVNMRDLWRAYQFSIVQICLGMHKHFFFDFRQISLIYTKPYHRAQKHGY